MYKANFMLNFTIIMPQIAYLYLLMKREPEEFYKLGDFDIVLTSKIGYVVRINPAECKRTIAKDANKANIAALFRKELFKLLNKVDPEEGNIRSEADEILAQQKEEISKSLIDRFVFGAGGDQNIPEDVKNKIEVEVEKVLDKNNDASPAEVKKEIEQNEDLMKDILMADNKKIAKSAASSKRDELLREKQMELMVSGKTIEQILDMKSEDIKVPVNNVKDTVETFNNNMTDIRFPNIDKACLITLSTAPSRFTGG